MAGRCAIVQPNYIPWKGYFDLMRNVDHFVLFDSVQYTRRDWRNRNLMKTPDGSLWLTIPVPGKAHRGRICEVEAVEESWKRKHSESWRRHYGRAAHASKVLPAIIEWYETCPGPSLVTICIHFIERINAFLNIGTRLHRSSRFRLPEGRNAKLLALCRELGCDEYVSGPAARNYLDEEVFRQAGVSVSWFDYSGYPEYPQPHPPFRHDVSVLDLLLCTGSDAPTYLRRQTNAMRVEQE